MSPRVPEAPWPRDVDGDRGDAGVRERQPPIAFIAIGGADEPW